MFASQTSNSRRRPHNKLTPRCCCVSSRRAVAQSQGYNIVLWRQQRPLSERVCVPVCACPCVCVCVNLFQEADLFTCVVFYFLQPCPSTASILFFVFQTNPELFTLHFMAGSSFSFFLGLEGPTHFSCRKCASKPTRVHFAPPPPSVHFPSFASLEISRSCIQFALLSRRNRNRESR